MEDAPMPRMSETTSAGTVSSVWTRTAMARDLEDNALIRHMLPLFYDKGMKTL